jgi:putative phage-type endonuclease
MLKQDNSKLIQGSQEWLDLRKSKIGASEAPVIMKRSPWATPKDLWKQKLGITEPTPCNVYMQRGTHLEPIARDVFNEEMGRQFEPTCVFHRSIPYMMASLDGLYIDSINIVAVEIKCPGKKDHGIAMNGLVPEKYIPQLQHQIEVAGLDFIYYFSYASIDSFKIIKEYRDQNYIRRLLEEEKKFWDCLENLIEPE